MKLDLKQDCKVNGSGYFMPYIERLDAMLAAFNSDETGVGL